MIKTTNQWKKYWVERKINWRESYLSTWSHPHRSLLIQILKSFYWVSLFEVGCGPGPNLLRIVKDIGGKQLGGCDVNLEAIELAQKSLAGGVFKVCSAQDIMMSDKSVDVVLTDMTLIYVAPSEIGKCLREVRRIAREYVVFCEFHSKSWKSRLALKWRSGYNAYNWPKLLEKHGFYDVLTVKIPEEAWPGGDPQRTYGYILLAKVPRWG